MRPETMAFIVVLCFIGLATTGLFMVERATADESVSTISSGRYQVFDTEDVVVLVDTTTGKIWERQVHGETSAWFFRIRLDNAQEASNWLSKHR